MSQGNTVRLHRVLATRPEKVFRAFLDADAMAKWLPPYGFTCKVHHMEAKVGGTFRMSFTNFTTGNGHSFGGEYLEIVPNERIRCICSIGKKSVGLVLILIPGKSTSLVKSFRLAACRITFSRVRSSPHCLSTCTMVCAVA